MTETNETRLIYDGDCGFCTRSAQWISSKWAAGPKIVSWQQLGDQELLALGLTQRDVAAAAWWADENGQLHRGHRAVGKALVQAGGPYGLLGRVLLIPPISWVAAAGYRLVARFRYRLPGGTPACRT